MSRRVIARRGHGRLGVLVAETAFALDIGPAPRLRLDAAYMAELARDYLRHRAELLELVAGVDPRTPWAYWTWERSVPDELRSESTPGIHERRAAWLAAEHRR